MNTRENSCLKDSKRSKVKNFYRLHCYGIWQTIFFFLLVFSIAGLMMFYQPEIPSSRGFWIRNEAFGFAFFIPFFAGVLCWLSFNSRWIAFSFTVLWGYLLALIWCWFFGITYLIPLAIAAIIIGNYNKIQKKDLYLKRHIVIRKVVLLSLATICASMFFGYTGRKNYLLKQEYIHEAKQIPTIELVDAKDNYIFTKEYGLEKATRHVKAAKGDKIHRLSVENGEVFVLVEK